MLVNVIRRTVLLGCFSVTMVAQAESSPPPAPAEVAEATQTALSQFNISGATVARIENGDVAWIGTFGHATPQQPVTRETVFNVASLTKPVFALLTLHLIDDEQLTLDESLSPYWVDPDVKDNPWHQQLTPRLILSHQTGFPNWRGNKPLHFMFEPGSRHEYSGEGYEYLRRAIERKTGKKLPELMSQYVTQAAGMENTSFGWTASVASKFAVGYDSAGVPHANMDFSNRGPAAASSMFTTIEDYAAFTAWVANGAGLNRELTAAMQKPQAQHENLAEYFGLGWRIIRVAGSTVLFHDGREGGVRTQVYVNPISKNGLVILTNSDNGELLTHTVVTSAISNGGALLAQVDRDTWHYLQSLPPQALGGLFNAILHSPPFTSKLLYAVDTVLLQTNDRSKQARQQAHNDIEALMAAFIQKKVGPEELEKLFSLLKEPQDEGFTFYQEFSQQQQEQWAAELHRLANTGSK